MGYTESSKPDMYYSGYGSLGLMLQLLGPKRPFSFRARTLAEQPILQQAVRHEPELRDPVPNTEQQEFSLPSVPDVSSIERCLLIIDNISALLEGGHRPKQSS